MVKAAYEEQTGGYVGSVKGLVGIVEKKFGPLLIWASSTRQLLAKHLSTCHHPLSGSASKVTSIPAAGFSNRNR